MIRFLRHILFAFLLTLNISPVFGCICPLNKTYTHNNHLGSANWITEQTMAKPIQYMYYLPFGQLLINQISAGYNERYKFTGKERDGESGYDYFGARYYNSSFMHWMSVDPLSDRSPGISPYAYCHWNPVMNIDPDGNADWSMVGKGAFITACGVSACIGGASLAASTVGAGAPMGALLLVDGYSGIGIGAAMITTGLLTDPSARNTEIMNTMPTSATNALAKSADIIAGTENHEIENVTTGAMIVLGMSADLQGTAKAFSNIMTISQAADNLLNIVSTESRVDISNDPYIENVNVVDNTRVDFIEKLQPIPYDN